MSILFLIDGLEPRLDCVDTGRILDHLAAGCEGGNILLPTSLDSRSWAYDLWGQVFPVQQDPPAGYLAALGLGLNPDPNSTWGCLEFTHLLRKQDQLQFVSPHRTGQTSAEKRVWLETLAPEFALAGWQMQSAEASGPETVWCGVSSAQILSVQTHALELLEKLNVADFLPSGAQGRLLHGMLNTGQLLLARHPLNQIRQKAGRLVINTPWMWGIGQGTLVTHQRGASPGRCWTSDPILAGLAVAAGFAATILEEEEHPWPDRLHAIKTQPGLRIVHLRGPAVLARHGLQEQRQARLKYIEETWLTALSNSETDRLTIGGLWSGAGQSLGWVSGCGRELLNKRRFWQRRQFGDPPSQDMAWFRARFMKSS